ncbi:MAG: multiheme c-type cytochrome [Planctomycetales bacterium]
MWGTKPGIDKTTGTRNQIPLVRRPPLRTVERHPLLWLRTKPLRRQDGRSPEHCPDRRGAQVGTRTPVLPPSNAASTDEPAEKPAAPTKATAASQPAKEETQYAAAVPPKSESTGSKLPPPAPIFNKWDKPDLMLVLSGEQKGYLEPCGCSATQSGGFSRRANFFQQLADKHWPVLPIDLGHTLLRTSREQDAIKFESILKGMREMKYAGLGIGTTELTIGPTKLLEVYQPNEPDSLPFLSANIVFFDAPDLGTPVPFRVVTVNGVKVAITSILGKKYREDLYGDKNGNDQVKITDPAEALTKLLPKLKAESPDLMVLLSEAPVAESKELAEKFPEFKIVLTAGGAEDGDDKPIVVGKSWVISVGAKGKHIGGVGYYKDKPLKYELVDLDNQRFQDTPVMRELMRYYQEQIKANDLVAKTSVEKTPRDSSYVGAKKCAQCHSKAYAKWQNSGHSHAYESLEKGRKGQEMTWISRVHDPECLACHVTGWDPQHIIRFASGFESPEKTPNLMGQQCENCHGPGSKHVEFELVYKKNRKTTDDLNQWRKEMHLDPQIAKSKVCIQCHDPDNSPKFVFEEYWKKIDHKGMRD